MGSDPADRSSKTDGDRPGALSRKGNQGALEEEPPVVARMVIEIRSDGSRTVARGALEDVDSGERVSIEARGDTPLGLAGSLLRSMAEAPLLVAKMSMPKLGAPRSRSGEGSGKAPSLRQVAKSLLNRGLRGKKR